MIAGLAAGLLCALLQWWLVEPQILLAERYESGELVHFASALAEGHDHAVAEDHAHVVPEAGGSQIARHLWTVLFSILAYAGYGLLVAGGMVLAAERGHRVGSAEALLFGLAGFLAFQGLPAVGLAPELPGVLAADLMARQLWWVGTAASAVVGLWLIGYGRGPVPKLAGIALLVAPQIVGAPEIEGFAGQIPPELAARFAARSLIVGLFAWTTLGL